MSLLLWGCWAIVNAWMAHEVYLKWVGFFRRRDPGENAPEIQTFLMIQFALLTSAFTRVLIDDKPFYPVDGVTWHDTGYSLAQLSCALAWILTLIYSLRWGFAIFLSRESRTRWSLGSVYGIFVLLGTALVLNLVFQIPF